jgi:hypothetical protein
MIPKLVVGALNQHADFRLCRAKQEFGVLPGFGS